MDGAYIPDLTSHPLHTRRHIFKGCLPFRHFMITDSTLLTISTWQCY